MRMSVRVLILIGLLLFIGACYRPDVSLFGQVEPTDTYLAKSSASENSIIPSGTVQSADSTPTSRALPKITPKISEEGQDTSMYAEESLSIIIVYDNNPYDHRLKSSWGFSALVTYHDHILLFDAGGDGPTLMENLRILGIDPTQIESVVLSHAHGDHTGGVMALLKDGARPTVYLLPSFPSSFNQQVGEFTSVVEVAPGQSIAEGLFTTGEMGRDIPEQALVVRTESGLVVITGCAHPGIVLIVEQAQAMFNEPVRLALGGFHLGSKSTSEINAILRDFRRLGVEQVAPCHCTGKRAIHMFAAEFGKDFIQAGVGRVIRFDTEEH
jgi:7,8-dihydropterin-6-yl-methyl-4-(beta-D-ribofuranosyl)aminobenzene 5'-phosphate synthase